MLLNCAKRQSATETALLRAAADPLCMALLLQEPWHDHRLLPPNLPGFIQHHPADAPSRPNCVTYVREGIAARQKFSHAVSFLEIEVTVGTLTFSILNFYSPSIPDHVADLLATRFITPPASCILMGDFNAHHSWWSACHDMDSELRRIGRTQSDAIVEWLDLHHFRLHNTPGVHTRFPMQRGTTRTGKEYTPAVLDLAFSKGPIEQVVTTWGIDDSPDSDHRGITLHPSFADTGKVESSYFRDWRAADWSIFDTHISRLDLDDLTVPAMTKAMVEAIEAAVPLKKKMPGKRRAPWWTPGLTGLQSRVKAAQRRARNATAPIEAGLTKCSDSPLWAAYDSLQAEWKAKVAHARSQYTANLVAAVDQRSVWRVLKRHQAHRKALPTIDGADDFEGKCSALWNALFPAASTPEPLEVGFVRGKADFSDESRPVTCAEVDRVVARLHYGSAVGPDMVSYEVVKRLHNYLPDALPWLFTHLFDSDTGTHPTEWKAARCVVIPKPGKA
jgi:hypothetical protein